MNKHTNENMTLEQWYKMLKRLAENEYGFEACCGQNDCAWKEFYLDGYSPREALDEDTYAGL